MLVKKEINIPDYKIKELSLWVPFFISRTIGIQDIFL